MRAEPRTWMLCSIRGEWTLTPPEGITAAEIVGVVELRPVLDLLERLLTESGPKLEATFDEIDTVFTALSAARGSST